MSTFDPNVVRTQPVLSHHVTKKTPDDSGSLASRVSAAAGKALNPFISWIASCGIFSAISSVLDFLWEKFKDLIQVKKTPLETCDRFIIRIAERELDPVEPEPKVGRVYYGHRHRYTGVPEITVYRETNVPRIPALGEKEPDAIQLAPPPLAARVPNKDEEGGDNLNAIQRKEKARLERLEKEGAVQPRGEGVPLKSKDQSFNKELEPEAPTVVQVKVQLVEKPALDSVVQGEEELEVIPGATEEVLEETAETGAPEEVIGESEEPGATEEVLEETEQVIPGALELIIETGKGIPGAMEEVPQETAKVIEKEPEVSNEGLSPPVGA